MTRRPYIQRVRPWIWLNGQHRTPGIGIWAGRKIVAHLTLSEAYKLADRIVDTAEKLEQQCNNSTRSNN